MEIRSYLNQSKSTIYTVNINKSEEIEIVVNENLSNKTSSKQFQLLYQKDKQFTLKSQQIVVEGFELNLNDWLIRIGNLILNNNKFKGLVVEIDSTLIAGDSQARTLDEFIDVIFPQFKRVDSKLLNYFKSMSFI